MEIISGDEEARLSFASAYTDFGGQRPLVVLDIGGGSTEFIYGDTTGEVTFRQSFDVGSVRLTERHMKSDPPSHAELEAIDAMLDADLRRRSPRRPRASQMVGRGRHASPRCAPWRGGSSRTIPRSSTARRCASTRWTPR